jgi:hypothetical protein
MILLTADTTGMRQMKCTKQRDSEPFQPIKFRLKPVSVSGLKASRVVVPADDGKPAELLPAAVDSQAQDAPSTSEELLKALRPLSESTWTRAGVWRKHTGLPASTYNRRRKESLDAGLIQGRGEGKATEYRLTSAGAAALHIGCSPKVAA